MKPRKGGLHSIFVTFDEKHSVPHQLFFKQHKIREESDDRPSDLTLFVCNVPPYFNEECLKSLFGTCGPVRTVLLASLDTPTEVNNFKRKSQYFEKDIEIKGYKVAYVIFESANGLQKALSWNPDKAVVLGKDDVTILTGLRKFCRDYNDRFPDIEDMEKEINEYVSTYDKTMGESEALQKQSTEPDEDGWVTVTKKGRNPGFARKQSVKDNIIKSSKQKQRKKTLLNFYTFQIKESKMNHLAKLREKFEEDKKKIATLKVKRKFKPF